MNIAQFISRWSDSYDREARLYPALLSLLPIGLLVICIFGPHHPLLVTAASALLVCGGPLLVSRFARDLGKSLEERLFDKWGGKPTTIVLRHRDDRVDAVTKQKYHDVLARGVGLKAPTAAEEVNDPATADTFYRAGTAWLIAQTQDVKKHSLVFSENKSYGFQRNLRGLKGIGIFVCLATLCISLFHTFISLKLVPALALDGVDSVTIIDALPTGFSLLMLFCWIFLVTEKSVERAGYFYADRLIRSCGSLKPRTLKKQSEE
ncbi:hypothetical protein GJ698_16460 [Pseudoduganella sp. FT26W]|uniref:Uncharacterized protein n=1 Tax=Duganella aquatilis TaxID=2666082 RepID=A0A844DDK5_9BURK|nr:hypothetical protein [Duganella aquatilis]MRW85674.1 hypothetical protein [Duganella aquatilis]